MKNKITTNHNIFRINDDESISINIQKINATLQIFMNNNKQFFIIKKQFNISKNQINQTIKKYHDK